MPRGAEAAVLQQPELLLFRIFVTEHRIRYERNPAEIVFVPFLRRPLAVHDAGADVAGIGSVHVLEVFLEDDQLASYRQVFFDWKRKLRHYAFDKANFVIKGFAEFAVSPRRGVDQLIGLVHETRRNAVHLGANMQPVRRVLGRELRYRIRLLALQLRQAAEQVRQPHLAGFFMQRPGERIVLFRGNKLLVLLEQFVVRQIIHCRTAYTIGFVGFNDFRLKLFDIHILIIPRFLRL